MRFFNTAGPVVAGKHYAIPPLARVDLEELLTLVRRERYFVLHAPRPTGKTTTLLALRDLLNSGPEGDFRCVYASLEAGRTTGGNVERAARIVLGELATEAAATLGDASFERDWPQALASAGPERALRVALTRWAAADPCPLVLLLDEVDTRTGDAAFVLPTRCRLGSTL